ncbi:MAG: hypothetical protein WCW40_09565 [Bacteroidota bacterium]
MQPEIPPATYYSFLILTVSVAVVFIREVKNLFPRQRSFAIGLSAWFFLQYFAGTMGFFAQGLGGLPPKIMIVVLPNFILIFYLWFSTKGGEIAQQFDLVFLTLFQSFRIFVELILWQLAGKELLPSVMSFEGRNFDVLIGVTAPVVAYLFSKGKISNLGLIIWNIGGIVLVTNVVLHGMLSLPGIELIRTNVPNFIISYAPFNLLPGVLVPIAYILHVFALRKLLKLKKSIQ